MSPHSSSDLPDSQESIALAVSSTFSAPQLPSSQSNLSTSTAAETEADLTAPPSTSHASASMATSASECPGDVRANVPRIDAAAANVLRTGDTAHGSKRTADGALKGAAAHKRNKSMDAHSGKRIGELSAQLKTRLNYAMVKVQNGWEKQSLEELEEVHSQRGSPNSAPGQSDRLAFDSPLTLGRQRRPSRVSDNSDQMLMSPASDSLGSHATTPFSYWRPTTKSTMNAAADLISVTASQHLLGLAPAPELQTGRRRRSSTSNAPPSLIGAGQRKHYSDLGVGQRTPVTPRPGILRMPSQQAEKDAVDTLLFMSSPKNSGHVPNSHIAPSPLRADAPQRRVMFEVYPPRERHDVYQPQMPPPPQHQYGPYAAHPAR